MSSRSTTEQPSHCNHGNTAPCPACTLEARPLAERIVVELAGQFDRSTGLQLTWPRVLAYHDAERELPDCEQIDAALPAGFAADYTGQVRVEGGYSYPLVRARSSVVVIENDVSGLRVGTPSDMKVDARFVGRYQGRTGYLIHALRSRHYNAGWFLCDAAGGFIKLYPRTEKQGRKMLTDWLTKGAV